MTTTAAAARPASAEKHPKGLYVLFATEMWERFSFYTVGAMLTLYMQDPEQGFGWKREEATGLNSNYLMFVYASPLIGGFIADRKLGYLRAVLLGGLFFIAGHALLAVHAIEAVYAALACLVVGNGFFKPNVSAMVGNLYPEGSRLKDQAYNIFYMGINVGAFLAPIVAEVMKANFGFHPAFLMGAFGMILSVAVLAAFRRHVDRKGAKAPTLRAPDPAADSPATAADVAPMDTDTARRARAMASVPDSHRVGALLVIFAIVIVFWMVFHQNSSTLTYWANDNTDWKVTGIISNAINGGWVIALTLPLIAFWRWLGRRGLEPSTPAKMAIGMTLTGVSFFVMWLAAKSGGDDGRVSPAWLIGAYGVLTLGELMLSPMGLSLVSKVAPVRLRGVMMGGWFVATAIGNKLTMIGVYWDEWLHSTFFAVLGGCALAMAVVLLFLLKPLKKAMPGV